MVGQPRRHVKRMFFLKELLLWVPRLFSLILRLSKRTRPESQEAAGSSMQSLTRSCALTQAVRNEPTQNPCRPRRQRFTALWPGDSGPPETALFICNPGQMTPTPVAAPMLGQDKQQPLAWYRIRAQNCHFFSFTPAKKSVKSHCGNK